MEESINYQSCCRLCLCEKVDTLKQIFDQTNNDLQLSQKILHSLTIQINNSDPVTLVCEDCIEKITNWNFYKQQCIENQKKFQELLENIVPVPPVTPPPIPAMTASENTTPNSNNVSMCEMTFHIKEEPADHDINDETREIIQEAMPENIVQQNDQQQICVKNEPLDVDEPMDQEYNEFPPTLSPHPFGLADSESDPAPNRDPDINRKCSVCGKIFSNAGNRKKHERVQHGLHPTVCVSSPVNKSNDITNGFSTSDAAKEQQKILFAMGLKLLQTNSKPISSDELSKIEVSYSEKCKAMVSMHKSLVCACHNVPHQNLKGLLSHLRALRIWFPVFTCYNCMITFTDRSTFTRHIARCSSQALNAITKLSNLKKRSEVKTRLYQNFKCTICKFMFSFHEDFCAHVDEDHSLLQFPVHCPCGRVFENVEDYKDHVYVSCLVDFYCDICFITTKTLDDFQKHAKEVHDQSEGFILLQDDNYKVKKPSLHSTPGVDESAILTGKRERRASARAPLALQDDDLDEVPSAVIKPTFHTPRTDNRICPICHKEYSSYKNMMRHYKNHKDIDIKRKQQEYDMDLEDKASYYSCPECGGMFSMDDWEKHLAEKHPSTPCDECGKLFQFRSDLEQHRSTHLNLKVYRDSKTHAYKSAMVSPKSENDVMLLCEICDVMFTTKEDLKNHKLTHELEDMNADSDPSMDANLDQLDLDIEPNIELAMEQSMETGDVDVMDNTRRFRCEVCEEEFNSYSGLWEHNRTKHPDRKTPNVDTYPKECKDCGKVCTTGAAFYRHRQIHEKPSINTVSRTSLLKKKLSENSEESYHTCKRCFKVFSSKYNLKNHLKCHGINPASSNRRMSRKAVCKICQQIFETQEELILHKKEQHFLEVEVKTEPSVEEESLIFTCDICVMTFNNKTALKKHKEKHNQVPRTKKMVFCKHCKIPFETIAQLTQHMVTEHDQRVKKKVVKYTQQVDGYSCNICKKSFGSAGALTTHIGWHKRAQNETNTKLMKPVTQSKVKVTVKEEPNEVKRLQCSTCFISLPNETALQVHILEKHRSVSAIMLVPRCNTCNKDFASQEEYETHKRLHDFLERQKQHEQKMLVRQQEQKFSPNIAGPKVKSYPCKHCNAAFSRSDTLGAHMRQFHKDYIATEFRCHYCDRVFEKQNSLTIHLKVHEKQRNMQVPPSKPLFACSICNMGFDLPKDLRAHTISAHPF